MIGLYILIQKLLDLYLLIVLIYCIFSFLYSFGIINTNNRLVYAIGKLLSQLCDPALNFIRQFMPDLGTIDISPIILFLGIQYIISPIITYLFFGHF